MVSINSVVIKLKIAFIDRKIDSLQLRLQKTMDKTSKLLRDRILKHERSDASVGPIGEGLELAKVSGGIFKEIEDLTKKRTRLQSCLNSLIQELPNRST
jgi:hypothetical protein